MKIKLITTLALIVVGMAIVGCGNDSSPVVPDNHTLNIALGMRSYYNKANGNYDALSPADKQAFEQLVGKGPEGAQEAWKFMKTANVANPNMPTRMPNQPASN
jgi:hypothetical protein